MKNVKLSVLALSTALVTMSCAAQKKLPGNAPVKDTTAMDTTKRQMPPMKKGEPLAYDKVITKKAISATGFFKVHKVEDKYYFEINDSILNRDILVVNRMAKGAAGTKAGMMGYGGDEIGKSVIQFEKGPNNKVFLRSISHAEISTDTTADGMYRALMNSNIQPLEASFAIAAFAKDSSVVFDVTEYIDGDNDILFFDGRVKRSLNLTAQLKDRSYIQELKAFPMNIEIRTLKTYMKSPPPIPGGNPMMAGSSAPATYELNSSLVLLPKVPMQPRYFDPRVGYFATGNTDFDANPQGVKRIIMATRWKLVPKPEDVQKYLKGELVEPANPIIYYIDPATPKKWVPFLIQGVNDWQVAFEQAGFKNAIIAKEAPKNDPTWSIDDARNSAIVYKPSSVANASGPHTNDPRSGQILETHINWYHNVMELLQNWYFIQGAPSDPRARKMIFDDALMGQLIRFVSSHEVGHTLGLRHNFGSSAATPVEKLRDAKWLKENGHTASIMDYARFNYVAQPEDKVGDAGMFPHIGEYDKWAIEWAYRWLPQFKTAKEETPYLNKLVSDRLAKNPRLIFGTESDPNDPRNQNEDLGDNSMTASAYGIKNLKRIMPNIMEWTKTPDEGYTNATTIYGQVVGQFGRYMGHVTKNIAGIYTTPSMVEQATPIISFVPKAKQKEAVSFLQAQLFTTPAWLMDKKLYSFIGTGDMKTIASLQNAQLSRLISTSTISKLLDFEAYSPSQAYTATELFNDLKSGIFSELKTGKSIDIYRRNLQKMYAEKMIAILKPSNQGAAGAMAAAFGGSAGPNINAMDHLSIVKGHVRGLLADIRTALPKTTDPASKLHLQDVSDRLKEALEPSK
ncbi:MAG: zinc-dependent metalloprotease [Ginsengibacter sp.]